jgi:hypothetical protein
MQYNFFFLERPSRHTGSPLSPTIVGQGMHMGRDLHSSKWTARCHLSSSAFLARSLKAAASLLSRFGPLLIRQQSHRLPQHFSQSRYFKEVTVPHWQQVQPGPTMASGFALLSWGLGCVAMLKMRLIVAWELGIGSWDVGL